jgi:cell division protein FtsB
MIITFYAVFGGKGLINRTKLANENSKLMEKINNDSMISLELRKEVDELNNSDKKLEQVAREKYGMVKEGEKIIKIKVDSTKK